MSCVNPNDPEYRRLLSELGNPLLAEIAFNKKQKLAGETIKPGVQELFESNPELAKTGTPQQYSQYLDTVFPDSKVKDIVYHGTDKTFEQFSKDAEKATISDQGMFFAPTKNQARNKQQKQQKQTQNRKKYSFHQE